MLFTVRCKSFFNCSSEKKCRGREEQMKNMHIQNNFMSRILQLKGFTGKLCP